MDSLNFYDIKAEKANAILRHNKLGRKMTRLFRLVETLVVLFLVFRLSFTALKHSGLIFREFSVILFSPRFVFVVGNLIVVILFAGSGRATSAAKRSGAKNSSGHAVDELYDEFLRRSEKNQKAHPVRRSENNKETSSEKEVAPKITENNEGCLEIKSFARSKSEVFPEIRAKKVKVLKRSETEKIGRKMAVVNYKGDENINKVTKCLDYYYPEDKMSGEEFRLKVEAFIARQQRFRREEFSGDELY